jgi:hypothetical protein
MPDPSTSRVHYRGLHGHHHIDRQRRVALLMIGSGLARVAVWVTLLVLYALDGAIRHLYSAVAFVSVLSVLALLLTDWGQVAASLAQFSAANAHDDAEHNRRIIDRDYVSLERLIRQAANEPPGVVATRFADAAIHELSGKERQ